MKILNRHLSKEDSVNNYSNSYHDDDSERNRMPIKGKCYHLNTIFNIIKNLINRSLHLLFGFYRVRAEGHVGHGRKVALVKVWYIFGLNLNYKRVCNHCV